MRKPLSILSILLLLTGASLILGWIIQVKAGEAKVERSLIHAEAKLSAKRSADSQPPPSLSRANDVQSDAEAKQTILYPVRPKPGESIGTLSIPKLDQTLPIIHGTDEDQLEHGVGHYRKSVLPGEADNAVLSGHRDTVFRQLGSLEIGDHLITKTTAGTFTFQINRIAIVDADDRSIIVPSDQSLLTVTTCYPFDYIGDAPQRYILVASLSKSEGKGSD